MRLCKHVLSLCELKLNGTKAKIRKAGPKLYFDKSTVYTFNLKDIYEIENWNNIIEINDVSMVWNK